MYICIISWIGSSLPFFSFLPSCFPPTHSISFFLLVWPVFHSWLYCLGVQCSLRFLPGYYNCISIVLSLCSPPTAGPRPFPYLCCLTVLSMLPCVLFLNRCDYFVIICCLSFLLSLLPWCPLPVQLLDPCSVYIAKYIYNCLYL
jgi:hypothetical protein